MKKEINPDLYRSTYKYYVKYRPDIAEEVIDIIIKHFDIKSTDRILDIGCGTGKVALAMDNACAEISCLDPDPKMLAWTKKITKGSKAKVTCFNGSDKDLERLKNDLGVFKIATICRAFHWMDQEQTLKDLNDLIDENGGVAIFSDNGFWSEPEAWKQTIKTITQKYLGEKKNNGEDRFKNPERLWTDIVAHSAFKFVETCEVKIIRNWNVESIIGCVFSYSSSAPYFFDKQINKFKKELKSALLSINPKGEFQETATWTIVLASKKPLS